MAWENAKPYPIELGGLNASADPGMAYPDALAATNVRYGRFGGAMKRLGHTTYNSTAMPATTRAITGVAQFNRRDTTTRYTVVGTQEKLFVCPTSGAWTELANTLGAGVNDYWDFAIFNNELICTNGVTPPRWTNGTAAGTSVAAGVWRTTNSDVAMTIASPALKGYVDESFVAGGVGGATTAIGQAMAFDHATETWRQTSWMSLGTAAAGTIALMERLYTSGGYTGTQTIVNTQTSFNPVTETWTSETGIPTGTAWPGTFWQENGDVGYSVGGTTSPENIGYLTDGTSGISTNREYNVITSAWVTRTAITTARTGPVSANIDGTGVVTGGLNTSSVSLTDTRSYDTFTDTWTSRTAITAAKHGGGGASGPRNGRMYAVSGVTTSGTIVATVYSYLISTDAWTTEASISTGQRHGAIIAAESFILHLGGTWQKFSATPAAPTAFYVEVYRGQALLARTSSFPSRMYYSAPGESREWMQTHYIDINPDDGDWITGMFVFAGRLYVTKTDTIYEMIGDAPFDPIIAIPSPIPLENVKGAVSNRSIVVTDKGVFYLAEDGFRLFDGARSILVGEKVQSLLDGYVQSRMKYAQGLWVRSRDEIWWSLTSTGSTHDTLLVLNIKHGKWSVFTGMACEAMATVEDANDIDQILFGTGAASDGKLYKAESGNSDNGTTIASTYQTGWFSPRSGLDLALPKDLFMWWKRVATTAPVVALRANYAASDVAEGGTTFNDTIVLTAAASLYFEDSADQRCRVPMAAAATSHALSLRITETSSNAPWELYLAALTTAAPPADGGFPT